MKNFKRKILGLLVTIGVLASSMVSVQGTVPGRVLDDVIEDTASYVYQAVANPQISTIGGEWAIIGLARSDYHVPESYYQKYYQTVENKVKALKGNLHDKKYTEYSRVVMALTAIGKDPRNVGGYNLLTPLGDYEKTIWQGLNGPIWALVALDSGGYEMAQNPQAKIQASRQMYIDKILASQLGDGGWSLSGDEPADPDITGMVLQAFANYQDQPAVKKATKEALDVMSTMQNEKGGYGDPSSENSESVAQMITGLSALGISLEDPSFVKNGNTLLDKLMSFYQKGKGFSHTLTGDQANQMASEQGLYACVAAWRMEKGAKGLYHMEDIQKGSQESSSQGPTGGLAGKHEDIQAIAVIAPGRSFDDIHNHKNKEAIEALASRKIINGKTQGLFDPYGTVTRAEFATIIINSLGLKTGVNHKFKDVSPDAWYGPYVGAANNYGIVGGISETAFNPNGRISKEEAAVMITRAAALSGIDTKVDELTSRNILAQFTDYQAAAPWAQPALAFTYGQDILDQSDIEIKAKAPMTRGEIAQMVYKMLDLAQLL